MPRQAVLLSPPLRIPAHRQPWARLGAGAQGRGKAAAPFPPQPGGTAFPNPAYPAGTSWEPFATTPCEPSPVTIVPWSHSSFSWGLLPGQLPLFLQPGRGWGSREARCGLRGGRGARQRGRVTMGQEPEAIWTGPGLGGTPRGVRKK